METAKSGDLRRSKSVSSNRGTKSYASQRQQQQLLPPQGQVALHRVLLDAYEFHGLTMLLVSLVYFMLATGFLYSQWGGFTSIEPAFKSTVVESMKVSSIHGRFAIHVRCCTRLCAARGAACTGSRATTACLGTCLTPATPPQAYVSGPTIDQLQQQQEVELRKVDNMLIGSAYMAGYMRSAIAKTAPLQLRNQSVVWIGPFAQVSYARILANVHTNCDLRRSADNSAQELECCQTCRVNPSNAFTDPSLVNNLSPSVWQHGRAVNSTRHKNDYIATIIGQGRLLDNATQVLGMIGGFAGEKHAAPPNITGANGSMAVPLPADPDILIDRTTPDHAFIGQYVSSLKLQVFATNRMGTNAAFFSMSVMYGTYKNHKTVQMITANSIPTGFPLAVYLWFVLFIAFTLYFTYDLAVLLRLSAVQSGGIGRALRCWWNWVASESGVRCCAGCCGVLAARLHLTGMCQGLQVCLAAWCRHGMA